jgi:hypothetical protein
MRTTLALTTLLVGCNSTVMLEDANNYSYVGDIDAPTHAVADGVDIEVCWDEVTDDIQCHEVDPTVDLGLVTLARFGELSEVEVEEQLSTDSLDQSALGGYLGYEIQGGETCAMLDEFTLDGTVVPLSDHFYEGGGTYLLLTSRGTTPGQNIVSMDFLEPSSGSDVTSVSFGPACATLDFSADLVGATPISMKSGGSSWMVDWGNLTVNGLGNAIQLANIDRMLIGYYEGRSVADVEASFLDLEIVATDLYEIGGEALFNTFEVDLAEADGFAGFDKTDGTWVLALMCTTCSNPAPLFATVIEPN